MQALKSKTLMFALLLAVFGTAQVNLPVIQSFVSPTLFGYVTIIIAIAVAVLRVLTTQPLSEK